MHKSVSAAALALILLTACASTAPRTPIAPERSPAPVALTAAAPEPAANDNLNAVLWTQTSVERDLVHRAIFRAAQAHLDPAIADPDWDAMPQGERKTPLHGLRNAVIVDIDETVLDNSPYQARLVREGNEYNEFTWAKWCHEEKAEAVPGALEFTRAAASKGVTVFYLSNRARDLREPTLANLSRLGFPIAADEDIFLGLGTVVAGCEQHGSEKGCRREQISRKYRVLMQIGDQLGDFVDVLANTPQGRRQAIEPYLDWIGERWFMLPNPTYGSWEPALFNNDWRAPAPVRRQAKTNALQVD